MKQPKPRAHDETEAGSQVERAYAENALADDLKDMQILLNLSTRLVSEDNLQIFYDETLNAAIALTRADAGTVQMLDESTQELVVYAMRGFSPAVAEHFMRVDARSNTSCGIALTTGQRTVIDFDVPESEDPDGSRRMHVEDGYLSAQSTPLITRSGKAIGMFSTHWRQHRRPTQRELHFLDLLARQAADLIERIQAETALRKSEGLLAEELTATMQLQRISSQMILEDKADAIYGQFLDTAIALLHSDAGSMQLYYPERDQLRLLASKGFTPEAAAFWEWVDLNSRTSCALALRIRQRAVVPDVEISDFMAGSRDLEQLRRYGVRAAQSTPLFSRGGQLLGMISNHWREAHQPSDHELRLLDLLARQVADLLERAHAETALRESEAKYRLLFNTMDEGYILVEVLFDQNDQPFDILYLDANPAAVRMTGTELVGKTTRQLDPNYEGHWFETFGRVAKTGIPERHEYTAAPLNVWYDFYVFKVGDPDSRRVAAIYQDITRRKQAEAAEHQQRQLSEILRDTALVLTSSLDVDEVTDHILANIGRIVPHDAASLLLLDGDMAYVTRAHGYGQLGAALERDLLDFQLSIAESDRIDQMLRTKSPVLISYWEDHGVWDRIPGMEAMRSLVAAPILERKTVIGFLKLHSRTPNFFIPEHARLLQAFAAQAAIAIQNARAHEDAQALAVLNERHRLARDLHDAVTQTLFSANMIADALPRLWDEIPDPAQMQLEQLQMLTRGALAEMRTLLLELRPEYLTNMDLEGQIRQLLDALRVRKRINIQFIAHTEGVLPNAVRIAFYRIAQEALNNIVKHAHATEVHVTLEARHHYLRLIVQDNGLGFVQNGTQAGLGLKFMTERADEVGAQIEIATLQKAGTQISVTWGEAKEDADSLSTVNHSRSDRR